MIIKRMGSGEMFVAKKDSKDGVFIIRQNPNRTSGVLHVKSVSFPRHMVGKRIRLKLEVLE